MIDERITGFGAVSKPALSAGGRARRCEARSAIEAILRSRSSNERDEAFARPQPVEAKMGFCNSPVRKSHGRPKCWEGLFDTAVVLGSLVLAGGVFPLAAGAPAPEEEPPETITPQSGAFAGKRVDILDGEIPVREFLRFVADYTGLPVTGEGVNLGSEITVLTPIHDADDKVVRALLEEEGWRLRERTLPDGRRVLVVSRHEETRRSRILIPDLSDPGTRVVLLTVFTSIAAVGLLVTLVSRGRRRSRGRALADRQRV